MNTVQAAQTINTIPWDGEKRIDVSAAQIAAAFAENARLKEYVRLGDHGLTDPEIAPPCSPSCSWTSRNGRTRTP